MLRPKFFQGVINSATALTWLIVCCVSMNPIQTTFAQDQKLTYPDSPTVEKSDDYFGVNVPDPYQWLEAGVRNSDDVKAWVEAQNKVTFGYLEKLPHRSEIEQRLTKLWDYEKFGTPFKAGGRYYFSKNDGLQNQSVVYQMDKLGDEPTVLIDPNKWADDGTVALSGLEISTDGRYAAYGVQDSGSDWNTWHVMEIATQKKLDDKLEWIKFGGIDWSPDNKGFFYSRYDAPKKEEAFEELNTNQKVYYHKLGTSQSEDQLIHQDSANPEWGFSPVVTEDGKYLVVTTWKGTDDRYRILYKPLADESKLQVLIDNFDNEFSFFGNEGSVFYFKSDFKSPKKCVLAIDVTKPERENWKIIIPQANEAMSGVSMVGDYIVANYLKDAKTQIKLYDLAGKFVREVEFPGIGTASGFGGRRDHTETFYSFSSFNRPTSVYRYDMKSGDSELIRQAKVDFDPEDFEVKQIFYNSKDGTRVPMFIAHKKGLKLDGKNPTLLYGYGGFNISLTPGFSISRLQWMEMGGVYAVANLRGGGEYGKDWHKAGTKTSKQNVFDDFIAAAEWLIDNKYTSKKNIGIQGRSNGGLLVGACMTQRPDLFGACLPAVGVMDMLKFQNWTAGRFWVDDYGSSKNSKEEFEALLGYSPYHNIEDGTSYPPTMVSTADTDDRVVPRHSFKFAARLQQAQAGTNPTLIRIESKAGHGAGKPTAKVIEEVADEWAFLAKHLELDPEFPGSN